MISILRKSEQTTATWAGGTTRQLAIYPKDGDYASRNFQWRISTATVEIPESTFSKLDGFKRKLMILNGELALEMEKSAHIKLSPYEHLSFDGGIDVVGRGLCTDFNLMYGENWGGVLQHDLVEGETTLGSIGEFLGIYVVSGTLTVLSQTMASGDFALLEDEEAVTVSGNGHIVISYVWRD